MRYRGDFASRSLYSRVRWLKHRQATTSMRQSGLEQVLLTNRAKLLRFLRVRLGDDHEAEDCLQDLWLKIRSVDSGPIAGPLPYLLTIARNLALDRRRSARYRGHRDGAWLAARQNSSDGADNAPSAERILIDRERLRVILAILEGLPDRTAAVFRMFRLEGLAQKTIARQFAISLSAVEKHLQRAYRAIVDAQSALDVELDDCQRPIDERENSVGNG